MIKKIFFLVLLTIVLSIFTTIEAQPLPPNGGHGLNGDQVPGGGAPLSSGLFILLGLSSAYGAKQVYDIKE